MIKRSRTEFGWVRQELKPPSEYPHDVVDITETDEKQIELMMRAGLFMARKIKLIGEDTAYLTPHQLDICWEKAPPEPEDPVQEMFGAMLFGVPFGEYFVLKHDMVWCRFVDEYGSNLAVHHKEVPVIAFPIASVQKRMTPPDPPFFRAIESSILQQITNTKRAKKKREAEEAAKAASNEEKVGDEPAEGKVH